MNLCCNTSVWISEVGFFTKRKLLFKRVQKLDSPGYDKEIRLCDRSSVHFHIRKVSKP
jgi:hypothetical protein